MPGQDGPGQAKQGKARQGQVVHKPGQGVQARPGWARPGQTRPGARARPGQARPGQAKARPGQARQGPPGRLPMGGSKNASLVGACSSTATADLEPCFDRASTCQVFWCHFGVVTKQPNSKKNQVFFWKSMIFQLKTQKKLNLPPLSR